MNVIVPIEIVDAMILAGTTVAEPAAGETLWVSGAAYTVDTERVSAHSIYACVQAHTGRTARPEADPAYWLRKSPSKRWAPFDTYVSTPATASGSLTYQLQPGFFNALSLYGIDGASYSLSIKDAPGGTDVFSQSGYLYKQAIGFYELLFMPLQRLDKLVFTGLPVSHGAVLTLTIAADAGVQVGIGMINIGDYRPLFGYDAAWGGTQFDADAEPISYSYVKTYDDGTVEIKRRTAVTSMRATVLMPRDCADYAVACIQEVLDKPVSCIATEVPGYDGLNVFGLLNGSVKYSSVKHATADIRVKGYI